jgi:glutamine amidotransferase-like uncharacterized protein
LSEKRRVPTEEGVKFAQERDIEMREVSAQKGIGINETFAALVDRKFGKPSAILSASHPSWAIEMISKRPDFLQTRKSGTLDEIVLLPSPDTHSQSSSCSC